MQNKFVIFYPETHVPQRVDSLKKEFAKWLLLASKGNM